ncbi:MAG: hypothetical protein ACLTBR_03185 [Anaerostipes sp.]|uniref:hypothetical protein n=1 Tax=Anaerostipes sp. TaxID=1872530 RepID=UPI0039946DCB
MNYDELFNEFYKENKIVPEYADTALGAKKLKQHDLFNYKYQKDVIDAFFDAIGKKGNLKAFLTIYKFINDFYDWGVKKGYTKLNPFANYQILERRHLLYQYVKDSNIDVIYEEEIPAIIDVINDRNKNKIAKKLLCEIVVGLAWNGFIFSSKDLASLKLSDIYIDGANLTIRRKSKEVGYKLVNTILLYLNLDRMEQGKDFYRLEDHFILLPEKIETSDATRYVKSGVDYINNSLKAISSLYKKNITIDTLSKSGFLKFVVDYVGVEKFNEIFEINAGVAIWDAKKEPAENTVLLINLSSLFGIRSDRAYNIKQKCFMMVRKSKWWVWENRPDDVY